MEQALNDMSEDDYEMLMMLLPPATAKLKKEHFISCLFNHKNDDKFNELFDSTLWDISNTNLDVLDQGIRFDYLMNIYHKMLRNQIADRIFVKQ